MGQHLIRRLVPSIVLLLTGLLAISDRPGQAQTADQAGEHRLYLPYVTLPEPVSLELIDRAGFGFTLAGDARHAFVTSDGWLQVIDLTDVDRPVEVAALELDETPFWSRWHGGWLYLRSMPDPDLVEVWDVRRPEQLQRVARFRPPHGIAGMDFYGERAYVCEADGISIFEVNLETGRPRFLGRVALPDQAATGAGANCHALYGGRVAIGDGRPAPEGSSAIYGPGLRIFDASDPVQPRELTTLRNGGQTRSFVNQLWADPERIVEVWHLIPFSGSYDALTLYSLDPTTGEPVKRGGVSLENRIEGAIERILFDGPRIIVIGRSWLRIVDASNIDSPRVVSRIDFDPRTEHAALVAGHLVSLGRELRITRIEDPSAPSIVNSLARFTGHPTSIVGHRDLQRVAVFQFRQKQLTLFDAAGTEPTRPQALALEDLGLQLNGAAIAFMPDGRLMVAAWHELVLVEPDGRLVARVEHSPSTNFGTVFQLVVEPTRAFLVGRAGLSVIGIDGDRLEALGYLEFGIHNFRPTGLAVDGDEGVLAWDDGWRDEQGGLIVLDLENPYVPREIGRIQLEGPSVGGVQLRDGLATVAHGPWLSRYDLRRSELAQWRLGDERFVRLSDVLLYGAWAFVSDADGALHAVDLRDPKRPRLATSLDLPGSPLRLAALPGRIFVAADYGGLVTVAVHAGPGFGPGILGEPPEH